jgi:hypothetical protein
MRISSITALLRRSRVEHVFAMQKDKIEQLFQVISLFVGFVSHFI